ncbi:MAG: MaoC family dehydratase N-terminal domain-containing protein [Aquamicrobium sp.]|uniref:MaoC family dehydratase n=1 Tax=Aquamicrobium sp. TaxID=1872579 RepID=UPI00349E5BE1|nr:MaoC family dehydratase N-terminal domain-containing protein [Aquamicrobium sp.]
MTDDWTGTYESLAVGDTESSSQLIDGASIDAFAHAIQSFNPLHMDGDWARANTPYPDRVAHGVMTSALMSRPIVQFCERFRVRTALLSTSAKYLKAVVVGDTVTTVVRLAAKDDEKRRIRFEVEARNQRGELVLVGEAIEKAL